MFLARAWRGRGAGCKPFVTLGAGAETEAAHSAPPPPRHPCAILRCAGGRRHPCVSPSPAAGNSGCGAAA
eukprot:gene5751-biopygen4267